MAILQIEYHTSDVDEWKAVFDRDPMGRATHGVTGHSVFQDSADPGHLLVTLEFAEADQAAAFREVLQPVWEISGARRSWILDPA
jgi:hypothetical protein